MSKETLIQKSLILIPELSGKGGVSNYYRILQLDKEDGVKYFQVNNDKLTSSILIAIDLLYRYFKFIIYLVKGRYKIIITNPSLEGVGKSFYRETIFVIITRLFRRRTIVFFRGWFDTFETKIKASKFKTFLFKIGFAKAEQFIVLGEVFKDKLISLGVPESANFRIETTVADSRQISNLNLQHKYETYEKEVKFLFLGRVEKIKGIYIAIDAFQEFQKRNPNRKSTLIIAGVGPELEEVKSYVNTKELNGVKFVGFVAGDLKIKILLESHIMIFPSYTEGMPNSVLEGMLYGLPIISSAVGAIPEIVKENINGFTTLDKDPSVYCKLITMMAENKPMYQRIALENHKTALEKFTTEKVRLRFLSNLENI